MAITRQRAMVIAQRFEAFIDVVEDLVIATGTDDFFGRVASYQFGGVIPVEDPPFGVDKVDPFGKMVENLLVKIETRRHRNPSN